MTTMKNTVLVLIAILMVTAAVLTIVSSSEDYAAEKLFYRTMQANRKIALNPDVVPPVVLATVENNLQKIIARYPETKVARVAHLSLARFYWERKMYGELRSIADKISATYPEDKEMLSQACFFRGAAYQKQDQWPQALKEYHRLRAEYPDTILGIEVSIYIADYYKEQRRLGEAEQAYRDAVAFYEQMESEHRGKAAGYAAANLLIRAHSELEQYEQAAQALEDVFKNYPRMRVFIQQLPNIEAIFIKELNNPDKALQLYEIIRDKTEDKRIIEFLDGRIEALTVQKTGQ